MMFSFLQNYYNNFLYPFFSCFSQPTSEVTRFNDFVQNKKLPDEAKRVCIFGETLSQKT